MINIIIKIIIDKLIILFQKSKIGTYIYQRIVDTSINNTMFISYNNIDFCFSVPNALNKYRVETFATKEPETLEWISSIDENSFSFFILIMISFRCG